MSRLAEIHDEVRLEWSHLQSCWQATREKWRDEVAESFENGRWQKWEERIPSFLRTLEDLEEIANRALRETA
jgi:hypothetical protein